MKILVLGNGFDLEHGLLTQYKDFLNFINRIKSLATSTSYPYSSKSNFKNTLKNIDVKIQEYLLSDEVYCKRLENPIVKELFDLADKNIWIKYFEEIEFKQKNKGWIDFESEISNVIKSLDAVRKSEINSNLGVEDNSMCNNYHRATFGKINKKISKLLKEGLIPELDLDNIAVDEYFRIIIEILSKNLNNLIRCLEIYLEDCVGNMDIKYIAPDISTNNFEKVLSFNYTNTYKRVYAPNDESIEYDYIHGKANMDRLKEKNNMVLGIDEYLDDDESSKELEFITFKKYFQRIHKKTGNKYKNWIQVIKEDSENPKISDKNFIYIFGHSLDVTDKDILEELLNSENTITTIYYYNKFVYSQQITNLIKIIGPDELIKRVSGENATIIFKQQQVKRKSNEKDMVEEQLYYLIMACINKNSKGVNITELQKELNKNIERLSELNSNVNLIEILNELKDFGSLVLDEEKNEWIKSYNFDICFEDSIMEMWMFFDIEVDCDGIEHLDDSDLDSFPDNLFSNEDLLELFKNSREFEIY